MSPAAWKVLTRSNMPGSMLGVRILAVRDDGKGYYGRIIDITADYVELLNGENQKQMLRFFDSLTHFQEVTLPGPRRYKTAAPRLQLES